MAKQNVAFPQPPNGTVWMTRQEAADYLGVRAQTLAVWASTHRYNLRFYKIGTKSVRYKRADLDAFLESRVVEPTAAGR